MNKPQTVLFAAFVSFLLTVITGWVGNFFNVNMYGLILFLAILWLLLTPVDE